MCTTHWNSSAYQYSLAVKLILTNPSVAVAVRTFRLLGILRHRSGKIDPDPVLDDDIQPAVSQSFLLLRVELIQISICSEY